MAKGKCNCGGVSFDIAVELSNVIVCHCSICRRATGANGAAVVIVENGNFKWTSGEELITSWQKPDADWQVWFCSRCGSPVPGINDDSSMYVPAGLISEGGESLQVTDHIWTDSKAVWDEIGDCGRRHTEAYGG